MIKKGIINPYKNLQKYYAHDKDAYKKRNFQFIKSSEHREKMRQVHLGKKKSKQSVEKMSRTRKKLFKEGKIKAWLNKDNGHLISGEKNPNWKGGNSFEPYSKEFNKHFKNEIKKRDNFRCLVCGIKEGEEKIRTPYGLTIHHIDYDKQNTSNENCCTLCTSCNSKCNKNRNYWTNFFNSLLYKK